MADCRRGRHSADVRAAPAGVLKLVPVRATHRNYVFLLTHNPNVGGFRG
jgi:hypothetical protein